MNKQFYFLSLLLLSFLMTTCKNEVDEFISKFKTANELNVDEFKNLKFEDLTELDSVTVNKFLKPIIDKSMADASNIRYFAQFNYNLKTDFKLMTFVANFDKYEIKDTVVFLFTTDKDFKLISFCAIKGHVNFTHHFFTKLNEISYDKTSGKFDFAEMVIEDFGFSNEFLDFIPKGTATMRIQKDGQIVQQEYIDAKDPMGMEELDAEQLSYLLSLFPMKDYPVDIKKIPDTSENWVNLEVWGYEGDNSQYFPCFRLPSTDKFHILIMDNKTDEIPEKHRSLFTVSTKGYIIDNKKLAWTDDSGADWASSTAVFDKNLEFVLLEIRYNDEEKRTDSTATRFTFTEDGEIIKQK